MQQHGSKYFAHRPLSTSLTMGIMSKGHISAFLERGHVAYQMKGNQGCINMVGNILFAEPKPNLPPLTLGIGSKCQISTFSEYCHVA